MEDFLLWVEGLRLVQYLRFGKWGYAAANTAHVFGIALLHDTSIKRAAAASALPAALLFGYGLRGFAAIGEMLARWYII